MKVIRLVETDSTNEYLKRELKKGLKTLPIAVTTLFQTNGKGRHGKVWESAKGENILVSIACHYKHDYITLTKLAAIITSNTMKNLFPYLEFKIKWPNDIVVRGKKIAGMLVEKVKSSYIIGIGININQTEFGELRFATSIKKISGQEVDNNKVIIRLLSQFETLSKMLSKPAIHMIYEENLWGINKNIKVKINNDIISGILKEVNYYGQLVLETTKGKKITLSEGFANIPYEHLNPILHGNF